jgi:GGDEF domain-containing protein
MKVEVITAREAYKHMKAAFSFFMPGGVLVLASLVLVHIDWVQTHLNTIVSIYPYVIFIGSILIGWRFNRSALVFGALGIAVAHRCLIHFGPGHPGGEIVWRIAYDAAVLLLPLNLLVLSFIKERGFFTSRGIVRLALILSQPFIVGIVAGPNPERFAALLEQDLVSWNFLTRVSASQIGLVVFIGSLAVIAIRFFQTRSAKESGFFWAVVAVFMALDASRQMGLMAFHLGTASFILLVSVIEVSYAMAFRDELTGLPARRALKEVLLKLPGDYCLAMLDIDHFKRFNDRHGHDVGDQVLRMVAAKLAGVSGGGKVFRYGGEEFTVIFPGKYADDAVSHLEELRKEVASSGFAIRSGRRPRRKPKKLRSRKSPAKRVSVTISIGAAWPGSRNTTPNEVLKAADKALYRAKKQGRNRVAI